MGFKNSLVLGTVILTMVSAGTRPHKPPLQPPSRQSHPGPASARGRVRASDAPGQLYLDMSTWDVHFIKPNPDAEAELNTFEKRQARYLQALGILDPAGYEKVKPKSAEQKAAEAKAAYSITHPPLEANPVIKAFDPNETDPRLKALQGILFPREASQAALQANPQGHN